MEELLYQWTPIEPHPGMVEGPPVADHLPGVAGTNATSNKLKQPQNNASTPPTKMSKAQGGDSALDPDPMSSDSLV